MQQFNRAGTEYIENVRNQTDQEDHSEFCCGHTNARYADFKPHRHAKPQNLCQYQQRQLGKQHSCRQSCYQTSTAQQHRFKQHQNCDMPFFHSENVVQSQFPPPPPDNKRVGIADNEHGKNRQDKYPDSHHHLDVFCPTLKIQRFVGRNVAHDIVHRGCSDTTKAVRQIKPAVVDQILHRHLDIKEESAHQSPCPSSGLASSRTAEPTSVSVSDIRENISSLDRLPRYSWW